MATFEQLAAKTAHEFRELLGHAFVGEPVDEHGFRVGMRRVDKKVAGRELDGRTWDQQPPRRTRDDFRR